MAVPLDVLIIEDSPDDVELVVRELRRGGFDPRYRQVESSAALSEALDSKTWDVLLCDYTMAGFGGVQALTEVRARGLDVPFIFVSGTIGEETAVAAMRAGAQDYVLKGNLRRLVPVIERELREMDTRRERARAEAMLRKLHRAVDHSASLIVITDHTGKIEYANGSFLERMGYTAEDVIGQTPSLWKSDAHSAVHYEKLWETVLSGRDWRGEFVNYCKDGSTILVSATISPIKDPDGRITHFISVQEDITERRLLEEQLHQAQKMEAVGQLTGGLAHDFNNLLTIIIGNLDLLADELADKPKAQELAGYALDAGIRGAELTRQLLAFSRRQQLDPKVIDINKLAAEVIQLLRRTLGEQVQIKLRLSDGLWPAMADPAQVESALANLAINARDAMPQGGHLTVETANKILDEEYAADNVGVTPGRYVMLAVSDTGTGIAPEVLSRVFEPFFTTKEKGRGTGLGLSMVYGFANQSGGHVKIYSELGHGTTVRLYLPVATEAVSTEVVEDDIIAEATGGEIVLVVEDNADVRRMVVSQLRSLGYVVMEAGDGTEALEVLRSSTPVDLLFTDVVMPGGWLGPDLAREARRLRPGIKVLLSSGYAEAAMDSGGHGGATEAVLHKPYRKKDLAQKVREVLSAPKA